MGEEAHLEYTTTPQGKEEEKENTRALALVDE
jgi:hypothetical protein